jgi:DNA-binding Lrp family transcriptional regulator
MTRREKLFGQGRAIPLDREAKVKLMHLARALMRRTEPGKAYGLITAKAFQVLQTLLYGFHNALTGRCFPSYERIAERTGCTRSTVALALKALEQAKLLTWHNRIVRLRIAGVIRVVRTSNAYQFIEISPKSSKSETPTGTPIKEFFPLDGSPLSQSLARLGGLVLHHKVVQPSVCNLTKR